MSSKKNNYLSDKLTVIDKSAGLADEYIKGMAQETMDRIQQGDPCFLVGAYTPGEIFKTMDIPTINNLGAFYYSGNLVSGNKYKSISVDDYDFLGQCIHCKPIDIPDFINLPKLTGIVTNEYECVGINRALQASARINNIPLFILESTASPPYYPRFPFRWWENIEDNWDTIFESDRLDNMVEQLKSLIKFLEINTGKEFQQKKLIEVMEEVNQGAYFIRKARNLIARTVPFPVGVNDILSVYGVWQLQHGDPKVTNIMKTFYEEVRGRVNRCEAVWPKEKLRLQWVKSWWNKNNAFYRAFEEDYGAVFGACWYLSMGADGYARNVIEKDPLRALASRAMFEGPYSGPDYDIYLAKLHKIDGAMMHTKQWDFFKCFNGVDMGVPRQLHKMAFDSAGIPMLLIDPEWEMEKVEDKVSNFLENL